MARTAALHITSHQFDHPRCLELASRSTLVLSVHGCLGESCIHVGGLDEDLTGASRRSCPPRDSTSNGRVRDIPERHPSNICNRGSSRKGAQLEITYDLRAAGREMAIARAVRRPCRRRAAAPRSCRELHAPGRGRIEGPRRRRTNERRSPRWCPPCSANGPCRIPAPSSTCLCWR